MEGVGFAIEEFWEAGWAVEKERKGKEIYTRLI